MDLKTTLNVSAWDMEDDALVLLNSIRFNSVSFVNYGNKMFQFSLTQ